MTPENFTPTDGATQLFEEYLSSNERIAAYTLPSERKQAETDRLKKRIDGLDDVERQSLATKLIRSLGQDFDDGKGNKWDQWNRDGAYTMLSLMDLKGVDQKALSSAYYDTLRAQEWNSYPYIIQDLLDAGQLLLPRIAPNTQRFQVFRDNWNGVIRRGIPDIGEKYINQRVSTMEHRQNSGQPM